MLNPARATPACHGRSGGFSFAGVTQAWTTHADRRSLQRLPEKRDVENSKKRRRPAAGGTTGRYTSTRLREHISTADKPYRASMPTQRFGLTLSRRTKSRNSTPRRFHALPALPCAGRKTRRHARILPGAPRRHPDPRSPHSVQHARETQQRTARTKLPKTATPRKPTNKQSSKQTGGNEAMSPVSIHQPPAATLPRSADKPNKQTQSPSRSARQFPGSPFPASQGDLPLPALSRPPAGRLAFARSRIQSAAAQTNARRARVPRAATANDGSQHTAITPPRPRLTQPPQTTDPTAHTIHTHPRNPDSTLARTPARTPSRNPARRQPTNQIRQVPETLGQRRLPRLPVVHFQTIPRADQHHVLPEPRQFQVRLGKIQPTRRVELDPLGQTEVVALQPCQILPGGQRPAPARLRQRQKPGLRVQTKVRTWRRPSHAVHRAAVPNRIPLIPVLCRNRQTQLCVHRVLGMAGKQHGDRLRVTCVGKYPTLRHFATLCPTIAHDFGKLAPKIQHWGEPISPKTPATTSEPHQHLTKGGIDPIVTFP